MKLGNTSIKVWKFSWIIIIFINSSNRNTESWDALKPNVLILASINLMFSWLQVPLDFNFDHPQSIIQVHQHLKGTSLVNKLQSLVFIMKYTTIIILNWEIWLGKMWFLKWGQKKWSAKKLQTGSYIIAERYIVYTSWG